MARDVKTRETGEGRRELEMRRGRPMPLSDNSSAQPNKGDIALDCDRCGAPRVATNREGDPESVFRCGGCGKRHNKASLYVRGIADGS